MPSGAKKRKAAKKKQGKQSHHVHSSTTTGTEEVRSQDERDSDGAETGSPVSPGQNPFKVENENAENKASEEVGSENCVRGLADEEVVKVVGLVESKEGCESKDGGVEQDKSAEELYNGNAKVDDYQPRVAENVLEEEHVAAIPVLETAPTDGSIKTDSVSEMVTSVMDECNKESQVAEKRYEEENVAAISVSETAPIDVTSEEVSDVTEKVPVGEANDSVLVTSPIIDSAKAIGSSSKEVACVEKSAPVEDSAVSRSNELHSKETEDNALADINEVSGDSSAMKTENEVFPLSYASSNTAVSTKDNETAFLSAIPQTESKSEDNGRETDIPGSSKNQPFMSSIPPQAVQKTSWLSCCGLLDAFSGTSR